MAKLTIPCPKCENPLKFRGWSKRDGEALADCVVCEDKWQVRICDGRQASEPYQVKQKARKIVRGSYKLEPNRNAAIVAIYGSVQKYLDNGMLVGMSLQYKS